MATIEIKNIPDDVFARYEKRALRSRQSLQEYLRALLIEGAARLSLDEVLERAEANAVESVSTDEIISALDRGRPAY